MICPNCRLDNPPSALVCDCGYHFADGTMPDTYLHPGAPGTGPQAPVFSIILCILGALSCVCSPIVGWYVVPMSSIGVVAAWLLVTPRPRPGR